MKNAIFYSAALICVCSAAAQAGPFDGIYRPNSEFTADWDCKTVGADGGALEIKGNKLFGLENTCELADPVNVTGMDAILYNATCRGEGMVDTNRTMILRNDHGVYVIDNGYASDWILCEK